MNDVGNHIKMTKYQAFMTSLLSLYFLWFLSQPTNLPVFLFQSGDFVHTMGDAHIYSNHTDAIREQVCKL